MEQAETDIPWHKRTEWPVEIAGAASLLRARYCQQQEEDYLQTGVHAVDEEARNAFTTFAPYAYDCTLWSGERELASVNDEGISFVVALTAQEADGLRDLLGAERLVTLAEWRSRHPSALTRLWQRVTSR